MKIVARIFGILFAFMIIMWGLMTTFLSNIENSILMWILSITLIISSIGSIFTYGEKKDLGLVDKWTLAGSEISFALGAILININFLQLFEIGIITYVLAIWLFELGVTRIGKSIFTFKINRAINKKTPTTKRWWVTLVLGIVMGIFSILSLISAFTAILNTQVLMGCGMLISGIELLLSQFED